MKSVLLNYVSPIKGKEVEDEFVYSPSMSLNVCKTDKTKVYIENERQLCGLKTKTEAKREQDDDLAMELSLLTKTRAEMEQDDAPSTLCYQ